MLEPKDFDCRESYEHYLKLLKMGHWNHIEDNPFHWKDDAGNWIFQKYEGKYTLYNTMEARLINIEILLKRVLEGKDDNK